MTWDVLSVSDYVGKYVKYTPPKSWNDYHDIRYGRVYAVDELHHNVSAMSYFDAFTGYEQVTIPLDCIIQISDRPIDHSAVPDEKFYRVERHSEP